MDVRYKPIPFLPEPGEWSTIPISENNENIIRIGERKSTKLAERPMYHLLGISGALEHCYLREEAVQRLEEAAVQLPEGYKLLIFDGYRPLEVQKALYDSFYTEKKRENPNLQEKELEKLVKQYVSLPSVNPAAPSPHLTGGSVDLTIIDGNGNPLPMGTDFDDFSEKASTRYYEELVESSKIHTAEEEVILQNRRLLYWLMKEAGFTNYTNEWWHFDFGNQWWAKLSGSRVAKYGIVMDKKIRHRLL